MGDATRSSAANGTYWTHSQGETLAVVDTMVLQAGEEYGERREGRTLECDRMCFGGGEATGQENSEIQACDNTDLLTTNCQGRSETSDCLVRRKSWLRGDDGDIRWEEATMALDERWKLGPDEEDEQKRPRLSKTIFGT